MFQRQRLLQLGRSGSMPLALGLMLLTAGLAAAQPATPAAPPEAGDPCAAVLAPVTPAAGTAAAVLISAGTPQPSVGMQVLPFDLVFLDALTTRDRGVILLAQIARVRAGSEAVRVFATDLLMARSGELDRLIAWRQAWYPQAPAAPAALTTALLDEAAMRAGAPAGMGEGTAEENLAAAARALCTAGDAFDATFAAAVGGMLQAEVGLGQLAAERAERPDLRAFGTELASGRTADLRALSAVPSGAPERGASPAAAG